MTSSSLVPPPSTFALSWSSFAVVVGKLNSTMRCKLGIIISKSQQLEIVFFIRASSSAPFHPVRVYKEEKRDVHPTDKEDVQTSSSTILSAQEGSAASCETCFLPRVHRKIITCGRFLVRGRDGKNYGACLNPFLGPKLLCFLWKYFHWKLEKNAQTNPGPEYRLIPVPDYYLQPLLVHNQIILQTISGWAI